MATVVLRSRVAAGNRGRGGVQARSPGRHVASEGREASGCRREEGRRHLCTPSELYARSQAEGPTGAQGNDPSTQAPNNVQCSRKYGAWIGLHSARKSSVHYLAKSFGSILREQFSIDPVLNRAIGRTEPSWGLSADELKAGCITIGS